MPNPLPAPGLPTFFCLSCGKMWALPDWELDRLSYVLAPCPNCGVRYSHPDYGWGRRTLQALSKYRRFHAGDWPDVFVSQIEWSMQLRPAVDWSKITPNAAAVREAEVNTFLLRGTVESLHLWCEACRVATKLPPKVWPKLYDNPERALCRRCTKVGSPRSQARDGVSAIVRLVLYSEQAVSAGFVLGPPVCLGPEPPGWHLLPKTQDELDAKLLAVKKTQQTLLSHLRSREDF